VTAIVKLDSFLLQHLLDRLAPYAGRLYESGGSVMIVGELSAVERVQPMSTDDEDARVGQVKLRLADLEVATRVQEDHLRNLQQAMFRVRSSTGTLDELLRGDAEEEIALAGAVLLDGARTAAAD
jgi:hypothetical protein